MHEVFEQGSPADKMSKNWGTGEMRRPGDTVSEVRVSCREKGWLQKGALPKLFMRLSCAWAEGRQKSPHKGSPNLSCGLPRSRLVVFSVAGIHRESVWWSMGCSIWRRALFLFNSSWARPFTPLSLSFVYWKGVQSYKDHTGSLRKTEYSCGVGPKDLHFISPAPSNSEQLSLGPPFEKHHWSNSPHTQRGRC